MKIIGLLCYYRESPTWLSACVASMSTVCDHIVALDGGYRLFPKATRSSGTPSHEAIATTCEALGIGLTHHVPGAVFDDNEVEKRNVAFRLGEALATPYEDWYFILDADELVIEHPVTLREDLEQTIIDVASASMVERIDWHQNEQMADLSRAGFATSTNLNESRRFYRAIPGLRAVGNHFTFIAEREGKQLTLRGVDRFGQDPTINVGVVIDHRAKQRDMERDNEKKDYYRLRDATNAELDPVDMVIG